MLKIIEGDLLKIEEGIVLHQVNCKGVTGGLAGALRRAYPYAFKGYDKVCNDWKTGAMQEPILGCFLISQSSLLTPRPPKRRLYIGHIFGQLDPGPNTELKEVDGALESLAFVRSGRGQSWFDLPIYAPFLMGCGLGGGDWMKYSAIIEKHLPDCIIVRKY